MHSRLSPSVATTVASTDHARCREAACHAASRGSGRGGIRTPEGPNGPCDCRDSFHLAQPCALMAGAQHNARQSPRVGVLPAVKVACGLRGGRCPRCRVEARLGRRGARSRFTSSARCAERGREGGGSGGFWLNGGASAPRLVAAVVLGDGVSIALTLQILRFTWTHRAGVRLSTLTKPHDASAEELARRLGRRPLGAAPPGTCAFASWQRAAG
jgi:hypothetical protein